MKIIISPSKKMIQKPLLMINELKARPPFYEEAKFLNNELIKLGEKGLEKLLKISPSKADEVLKNCHHWDDELSFQSPSLTSFGGTAFQAIDASSLDSGELLYAYENVLILSGLYGVLKGGSLISPYRIDYNDQLRVYDWEASKELSLKQFWKTRVHSYFQSLLKEGEDCFIDLASTEYSSILSKELSRLATVIRVDFRQKKADKWGGVASAIGKRLRGELVRELIKKKIDDPEAIKKISVSEFHFNESISHSHYWLFT